MWKFFRNSTVKIFCDNMAVVQVVESTKSKDDFLAAYIRNIWLLAATFDIDLHISHIQGKNNTIADTLSRIYSEKGINPNLITNHLRTPMCGTICRVQVLTSTFMYNFRWQCSFFTSLLLSLAEGPSRLQTSHTANSQDSF